ncbi:hypothetical protein MKZ38_003491 [Zalerion maritima]|uniref:Uncharacterized protein n=1 Tax=Zalerion maritima TaxID=339359 RepID=A0AAD5RYY5_9PEZI|nr:hypothetical protein MKZ38_003491 [Zalerion maritima]
MYGWVLHPVRREIGNGTAQPGGVHDTKLEGNPARECLGKVWLFFFRFAPKKIRRAACLKLDAGSLAERESQSFAIMATALAAGAAAPMVTQAPFPVPQSHLFKLYRRQGIMKRQLDFSTSSYGYYYGDAMCGVRYPSIMSPEASIDNYRAEMASSRYDDIMDCYGLAGDYYECITDNGGSIYDYNIDDDIIDQCLCDEGIDMIECTLDAFEKNDCLDSVDAGEMQLSLLDMLGCTNVPESVFTQIKPPKTVSLELETVRVTTPSSSINPPPLTYAPLYQGTGGLLTGRCTNEQFTLVDAGSTKFWAPFVGCDANRPECCPWQAAATNVGATSDTTITVEVSQPTDENGEYNAAAIDYPVPDDAAQGVLGGCPDDYYTVSGSDACCPIGHFPFTSAVGGQTPCWSSFSIPSTAPKMTAGLDFDPNVNGEDKPTSAVVNIVYSMQYPVKGGSSSKLSTGAIVGIAVGGAGALVIIALLVWFLMRSKKKTRAAKAEAAAAAAAAGNTNTGNAGAMGMGMGMGMGTTEEKPGVFATVQTMHSGHGQTPTPQNYTPSAHTSVSYPSTGSPSQLLPNQTGSYAVSDPSSQCYYQNQSPVGQQPPQQQFSTIPEGGAAMYGQQPQIAQPQPMYHNGYGFPQQQQQPQQHQWQQQMQVPQAQGQGQEGAYSGYQQQQQQQQQQVPQEVVGTEAQRRNELSG